jgi:hypothetical protein
MKIRPYTQLLGRLKVIYTKEGKKDGIQKKHEECYNIYTGRRLMDSPNVTPE